MVVEERPLRRDARRNRELLVAAAREVFGAKGLDAPLDEIARRAGVAIGTLYNRFPTRTALIEAAFEAPLEQMCEEAKQAAAFEDPWDGFVYYLERNCEKHAIDQGLTDLCQRTFEDSPTIEAGKAAAFGMILDTMARAQASGRLRADFQADDLVMAITSVAGSPGWRRHLGFLLDGFRAEAAHPLPDA
jgi:AcrR family transcriptional regulator